MKILITSALPYANGPLHFGHIAGAYLPGDCYARFQRLRGNEVLYLCGSDEYGVAITLSAELAGRTPQEHVDHFHEINKAFFQKLHFSFDHYSRTTWSGHAPIVQSFFRSLRERGLIEERTENHLYSESEGRFLADRYVVGICPRCGYEEARGDECQKCAASYEATDLKNPRSKLSGAPLTLRPSAHLYLRFDAFQERLSSWLRSKTSWKDNVVHFAQRYIDELKPRAITRDSSWGVPVPDFPNKVFYVWFDAPIGYVSAAQEWARLQGRPEAWRDYWLDPEVKLVHFIGKDNIPFHAVFFPAMLMGQNEPYKLPDEIPANEFYLLEGRQFSKSEGWTIDLESFFHHYTADQIRYAIAANAPETADSEFSWKDFQMRCNAELLGKFGNFIHRVMVFVHQHAKGEMPSMREKGPVDEEFATKMGEILDQIADRYDRFKLREASQLLMSLAQLGNVYFDHKKPWVLAKDPAQRHALETTLALCIECIQKLALAASPILPATAQTIWERLGYTGSLDKLSWQKIASSRPPVHQRFQESIPLFKKVEDAAIDAEIAKLKAFPALKKEYPVTPAIAYEPLKEAAPFETFAKIDLRVAQILEATKVPKSKKLLQLKVDLGFEQRTVVSGIALTYTPEQLIGKKVLFLANLPPATILGIESQGMVLAASSGTLLELPSLDQMAPGATVS